MKKLFLLIFGLFVGLGSVNAQCPMCKASVESNMENDQDAAIGVGMGNDKPKGMGLNSGILYLMAIPYVMVMTILLLWYRARKLQEKNAPRFS